MLHSQASAATATSLLDAASCANTGAATSGNGKWLDVRLYDGQILVTPQSGAVNGATLIGKLQSGTDANGTGAADITGAVFTTVTAANKTHTIAVDPKRVVGGFLGYVGTISVASPVLISVTAAGKLKYV
jgi:hypothetical protein